MLVNSGGDNEALSQALVASCFAIPAGRLAEDIRGRRGRGRGSGRTISRLHDQCIAADSDPAGLFGQNVKSP